jgi:hypothetical protein
MIKMCEAFRNKRQKTSYEGAAADEAAAAAAATGGAAAAAAATATGVAATSGSGSVRTAPASSTDYLASMETLLVEPVTTTPLPCMTHMPQPPAFDDGDLPLGAVAGSFCDGIITTEPELLDITAERDAALRRLATINNRAGHEKRCVLVGVSNSVMASLSISLAPVPELSPMQPQAVPMPQPQPPAYPQPQPQAYAPQPQPQAYATDYPAWSGGGRGNRDWWQSPWWHARGHHNESPAWGRDAWWHNESPAWDRDRDTQSWQGGDGDSDWHSSDGVVGSVIPPASDIVMPTIPMFDPAPSRPQAQLPAMPIRDPPRADPPPPRAAAATTSAIPHRSDITGGNVTLQPPAPPPAVKLQAAIPQPPAATIPQPPAATIPQPPAAAIPPQSPPV